MGAGLYNPRVEKLHQRGAEIQCLVFGAMEHMARECPRWAVERPEQAEPWECPVGQEHLINVESVEDLLAIRELPQTRCLTRMAAACSVQARLPMERGNLPVLLEGTPSEAGWRQGQRLLWRVVGTAGQRS